MSFTSSNSSSDYLSKLINSGPDAQSNLFLITFFTGTGTSSLSQVRNTLQNNTFEENVALLKANSDRISLANALQIRAEKVSIPSIGTTTKKIPYQNVEIEKRLPSSSLERKIDFDFRLDANYTAYTELQKLLQIETSGYYNASKNGFSKIKIEALTAEDSSYATQAIWIFKNCYLTNLGSFDYNYQSANTITLRASFIYETLEFESS